MQAKGHPRWPLCYSLSQVEMRNEMILEQLLNAYSEMIYSRYSDWGGAQRLAEKRFNTLLDSQSEYTQDEISKKFFEKDLTL